jgi:hypothetical protein
MIRRLKKSLGKAGVPFGDRPARYSITSIDIVVQVMFTLIVILRLWKGWDFTLKVLMWSVVAAIYVAPGAVAIWRRHPARARIVAFNALLGWTGVGWAAALVWSTRRRRRRAAAL